MCGPVVPVGVFSSKCRNGRKLISGKTWHSDRAAGGAGVTFVLSQKYTDTEKEAQKLEDPRWHQWHHRRRSCGVIMVEAVNVTVSQYGRAGGSFASASAEALAVPVWCGFRLLVWWQINEIMTEEPLWCCC